MLLLLGSFALASDWPTARGPADGTQSVPGTGDINGLPGGYPVYAWRAAYSSTSYTSGYSAVVDIDGDGRPETIGVTRSRVFLWEEDGSILAVSDSLATPYLHGVYDLDGDGRALEVVVAASGVGGGVYVLNAETLALLWRSDDPGLNGGGAIAETAVVDTDGDTVPELLWSTSFTGYADYRLLSFTAGFGAPIEVIYNLPTTSTGLLPVVAGVYRADTVGFLVEQGTALTWIESCDRTDVDAVCSVDESRCLCPVNQYAGIHATAVSGDRVSFDADGDGDSEYLSTSANDLVAVDIGVFDPGAGATTADIRLWQYRYGNGAGRPLDRFVYAPSGQGLLSSAGEAVVVATVYGSETDETDADGAPADDCVDAPDQNVTIAFDAVSGTALAWVPGVRAHGFADVDGDGAMEVVTSDDETEVSAYELVCDGPGNTGSWSSCTSTGCSLELAWSVPGTLPRVLPQQIPADSWHSDSESEIGAVDLDGDGSPEILVEDSGDLVAYDISAGGTAVELGRHSQGTCGSLGGWVGEGADTWLLLEGTTCHTVLDARLDVVSQPDLTDHTQGVGLALIGDVGRDIPVVTIGSRVYSDPSSAAGMDAPLLFLPDVPVRFHDFDGDGREELVSYRQGVDGDWRVAVYGWTGISFSERWFVTSSQLGGADRNISATWAPYQFTAGDFDGDGDEDLALYATDYVRGGTAFPENGTFFLLDGQDGSVISSFVGPSIGPSTSFAEPMQAADICAGTTCPGTDGVDELVFLGAGSVSWYGASVGYLGGWSMSTTSEAIWGDFDGDGGPEIALGAGFTSTSLFRLEVVEIDGTQVWETTPSSASGSPYTMHAAADVNEDGALDLIVGGGYGEITVYSGVDGDVFPGFPVYLDAGVSWAAQPGPMRRVLQPAMADIDGDGLVEAVVAHDDGYLYALNLSADEGGPSLLWSLYLGSPVYAVRPMDADGDGVLELMVLANDGTARLIDGGETQVTIEEPLEGDCVEDAQLTVSGTAESADEVAIFLQGLEVGRAEVDDGEWTFTTAWPSEGTFRVEVWAVVDEELVASDSVSVTWYDDADGDGVTECGGDCDDSNPDRAPGLEDVCDGVDADCDGGLSSEADDDADGFLACEECDDGDASSNPEGEEVCDDADNDCDGEVDEGDVCVLNTYVRGGGGCGCDSGGAPGGLLVFGLAIAGVVRRRR